MSFALNSIMSLSIGIGALIGWVRFRKIDPAYTPFIWLTWLGFFNEVTGITIMLQGYTNAVNYNLYALAEALLIAWQFQRWGTFRNAPRLYPVLQGVFILFWVYESFIFSTILQFNSYFTIVHSFIIVLLSISTLNQLLFRVPGDLWKHPVFLIGSGWILYFLFAVLVEAFWLFGLNRSVEFRIRVYALLAYTNLFVNLLFAIALLWIPMKRQYILQS